MDSLDRVIGKILNVTHVVDAINETRNTERSPELLDRKGAQIERQWVTTGVAMVGGCYCEDDRVDLFRPNY